ncbi:MAG: ATP-binding protein [Burkholderiaceae bacterium]
MSAAARQALLAGCDRASHLVQQMLTLARLEATGTVTPVALDLASLARQVAAEMAPQALARRQSLVLDGADQPCPLQGDAGLLAVLLRNLIDNAVRYSPPGGRIVITLGPVRPGAAVSIQVEDSGPGLAPEALARLGERFFRAADATVPGSGLGWSIVQRIAQAHGATLQAGRSATLGGLSVTLAWPALG